VAALGDSQGVTNSRAATVWHFRGGGAKKKQMGTTRQGGDSRARKRCWVSLPEGWRRVGVGGWGLLQNAMDQKGGWPAVRIAVCIVCRGGLVST
jgi:hypothetical protein